MTLTNEETKKKIKNIPRMESNGNTTYHNLCDMTMAILRKNCLHQKSENANK